MSVIDVKVILPKMPLFDAKKIAAIVDKALDKTAQGAKDDFEATTRTWKNRPTFIVSGIGSQRIIFTTDKIYKYVNDGTEPHIIRPRRARVLHFYAIGFKAKTRWRFLGSSAGATATEGETFTQIVHHPGNYGREFNREIAEKWEKELPIELQRAIDAAVR